jgi:hypothetical protein
VKLNLNNVENVKRFVHGFDFGETGIPEAEMNRIWRECECNGSHEAVCWSFLILLDCVAFPGNKNSGLIGFSNERMDIPASKI